MAKSQASEMLKRANIRGRDTRLGALSHIFFFVSELKIELQFLEARGSLCNCGNQLGVGCCIRKCNVSFQLLKALIKYAIHEHPNIWDILDKRHVGNHLVEL